MVDVTFSACIEPGFGFSIASFSLLWFGAIRNEMVRQPAIQPVPAIV